MSELVYIGGFSGGIDSQAAARFMLNRHGAASVILVNSDAGGNEHPLTLEHVNWYSDQVHPVVRVRDMLRCRVFLADDVYAQLVVLYKLHAHSLSRHHREVSE